MYIITSCFIIYFSIGMVATNQKSISKNTELQEQPNQLDDSLKSPGNQFSASGWGNTGFAAQSVEDFDNKKFLPKKIRDKVFGMKNDNDKVKIDGVIGDRLLKKGSILKMLIPITINIGRGRKNKLRDTFEE